VGVRIERAPSEKRWFSITLPVSGTEVAIADMVRAFATLGP
jgi:hypothetical protein